MPLALFFILHLPLTQKVDRSENHEAILKINLFLFQNPIILLKWVLHHVSSSGISNTTEFVGLSGETEAIVSQMFFQSK